MSGCVSNNQQTLEQQGEQVVETQQNRQYYSVNALMDKYKQRGINQALNIKLSLVDKFKSKLYDKQYTYKIISIQDKEGKFLEKHPEDMYLNYKHINNFQLKVACLLCVSPVQIITAESNIKYWKNQIIY